MPHPKNKQAGYVWMLLSVLLAAEAGMLWLQHDHQLSRQQLHNAQVLAQASKALLAYASEPFGLTNCAQNCPRPGDLPCPDLNNDGAAEISCNTNAALLGRLPWRTLGVGDLRDAAGERLWYAVSRNYKNNRRALPLNLDTPGGISLRAGNGDLRFDASRANGVVAVVIAPMQALRRADGLQQQRHAAVQLQPAHYLDIAMDEDNANVEDNQSNGLIQSAAGSAFNDVLLPVTASAMHHAMQQRVLRELAVLFGCNTSCASLPAPAAITDSSCLGNDSIAAGGCQSGAVAVGRLPLDAQAAWPLGNSSHLLSGNSSHHWFQQNGWRELVFYQPANQAVTLMVAGEAQAGQSRHDAAAKSRFDNYLESASLQALGLPQGDLPASNDSVITIPRP